MAELVDALDLGSSSERSEGSSPFIRIYYCRQSPTENAKLKMFGMSEQTKIFREDLTLKSPTASS